MSEEQQSTQPDDTPPVPADPGTVEPEPEPEPEPTPPAPVGDTLTWEPRTWYSITYACRTVGCRYENHVGSAAMFYSNNGDPKYIRVNCSSDDGCGKDSVILTADKLDPQPIEE
ncbi:hypothetical protein ACFQ0X_44210 [Streptomyces rectiviolaceus]|uniref:Uncharacterized protein n=1 Tax=Streptomyces rectiviolaceus TaxID=332591 RepID=A0ABP6NMM5_9ACTN